MTSRFAIAALASVIAAPAFAADLGGNCCADLEERIAELEATTARKGNRKVSLTVSGHVNEMMVFWSGDQAIGSGNANPGALLADDSGFAVLTNNNSRSRFRFNGSANINAEWSAGFLIEIGVRGTNNSQGVTAANLNVKSGLDVRHEALYIDSKRLGRVWLGHTGSATEGITEICVGCTTGQGIDTGPYLGSFSPFNGGGRTWQQLANGNGGATSVGEGDRRDIVMYVSPAMAGFTLSAAVGSDEFYDVALRYAGEFNGIRIAAGVGYQVSEEQRTSRGKGFAAGCQGNLGGVASTAAGSRVDCEALGLSASVMHVPTGLYVHGAWGRTEDNNANQEDDNWYVTAGINRKFHALGATNIYGEYGEADRGIVHGQSSLPVNNATPAVAQTTGTLSEMRWYGVGVTQQIDAAAMEIYLQYKHYEGQFGAVDVSDLDVIALGAIIKF